MKYYGSRENRGRTSPSLLSPGAGQGPATPEELKAQRRQTAVTVVRRIGQVANVAVAELVRMASREGDPELANALAATAGDAAEFLVRFTLDEHAFSDLSEEG